VIDTKLLEFCETGKVGKELPIIFCQGFFAVFERRMPVVDGSEIVDVV
jgi:hypothetical protein